MPAPFVLYTTGRHFERDEIRFDYFVTGIPCTMRRYIFHIITAGKLMVRYRVVRSPVTPPTIATIHKSMLFIVNSPFPASFLSHLF